MKISSIKETCLYVSDLEKTRHFYADLLGLEVHSENPESYVFFRAGDDMLLCFLNGTTENQTNLPPHFAKGEIHFAFEVSVTDYPAWKKHLKENGIEIEHEQEWPNDSRSFYFRDPDRNCVEILSPGLWD